MPPLPTAPRGGTPYVLLSTSSIQTPFPHLMPRGTGMEEQMHLLLEAVGGSGRSFPSVDHPLFSLRAFQWDPPGCTCGADDAEATWWETHPHDAHCVTVISDHVQSDVALWQRYGWPTGDYDGLAIRCTCAAGPAWHAMVESGVFTCTATCATHLPHFLYHPTGWGVQWYKYPFRASDATAPITLAPFSAMIATCLAGLAHTPPTEVAAVAPLPAWAPALPLHAKALANAADDAADARPLG